MKCTFFARYIPKLLVVPIVVLFATTTNASRVFAQTPEPNSVIFSDTFDDGFTKWITTRTNPEISTWKIVDGQAEAVVKTPSRVVEMVPRDAFWNSNATNFEYQLDYTPLEGIDKNISFNFRNLNDWYEIHFVDDFYNLVHLLNGETPFSLNRPYVMTNGQTYRLKIRFENGRIRIWVNEDLIGDEVDLSFTGLFGKIGIKAGTGSVYPTRVRFDNILVTSIQAAADIVLAVPAFSQLDPLWKNLEYDHASTWSSQTTIERWGCALTSLAMIFRYHGIENMPDLSLLTPATLNAWLKTQPDGYVGDGLVNWLAATRLARQLHAQFGSTKLEYAAAVGAEQQKAQQEIAQNRPVILQIAGHFLVGKGLKAGQKEILINDPAYSFTTFSDHRQQLLSTRTFTPSNTDLSYLLIVHPASVQVTISDAQGKPFAEQQTTTETLNDRFSYGAQNNGSWQTTTLAKPATGSYTIAINSITATSPEKVQVFAYDQEANVSSWTITGPFTSQQKSVTLSYQKTGASQLLTSTSWDQLLATIETLNQHKNWPTHLEYKLWKSVATTAKKASLKQQYQLYSTLKIMLFTSRKRLRKEAWQQLDSSLATIRQELVDRNK